MDDNSHNNHEENNPAVKKKFSTAAVVTFIIGITTYIFSIIDNELFFGFMYPLCTFGTIISGFIALGILIFKRKIYKGWLFVFTGIIFSAIVLCPFALRFHNLALSLQCGENLHAIGEAIQKYQNDYNNQNPTNLEMLVDKGYIQPEILICPLNKNKKEKCSYIYRGRDVSPGLHDLILVYDKIDNHREGWALNFLMSDFHVLYFDPASEFIERDNKVRRQLGLVEKPLGE